MARGEGGRGWWVDVEMNDAFYVRGAPLLF